MTGRCLGDVAPNPEHLAQARELHEGVIDLARVEFQPLIAAGFDWSEKRSGGYFQYPMFLNNILGTCVLAGAANDALTESWQTGTALTITDDDIRAAYKRFGGYVEGRPETDRGCCTLDVLRRLVAGETIAGQSLRAFVALDPRKPELLRAASYLFGGLLVTWKLPTAWETAKVWDVSPTGSTDGDWEPASWGRHATFNYACSPAMEEYATWTERQASTPAAKCVYMDGAYALLWKNGRWAERCPAGVDEKKLMDSMVLLGKASAW